ncbi:DUF1120 domain-containing protein [Pseudomonas sp. NPDC098747]|uniref:DUF1120 domain-containing protein n=1 Tax=Pseudomonas sp. NPDC098747 TaxID=3364487 RepID=UPI00383A196D
MKKLLLLSLALASATNAAMAANSVDLRVTGTITPAACNITMTGGDFDLGTISASALSASEETRLPLIRGRTLEIHCAGAQQVGFKAIDNRKDEKSSSSSYGLGRDGANNPIGNYYIHFIISSVLADGTGGKLKYSWDSGNDWDTATALHGMRNSDVDVYAFDTATSNNIEAPLPLTSGSVELLLAAFVQPLSNLDASAEITIDGSATIELVYL